MTEYLTMNEYLELSRRTIGKYAPRLIGSQDHISDVAYSMMIADKKFNGLGNREAFRVYYGRFAIKTILSKIKKMRNRNMEMLSLDSAPVEVNEVRIEPENHDNINVALLLQHCPEKHRQLLNKYFINQIQLRVLAEQENVSFQAIHLRIQNAIKKIKESIDASQLTINDFIN